MLKRKIIGFTVAFFVANVLLAQLSVNEEDSKLVDNQIDVDGPVEVGEVKKATSDSLEFISGDYLIGELVKFDKSGLVWNHPDALAPITFKPTNLDALNLGHVPLNLRRSDASDIYLTNGDKLYGIIDELNEEFLILDTWYAGRLKLEKPMIKSIASSSALMDLIYEGPNSLSEWEAESSGSWGFRDDYLYSANQNGGIGKDVKLPDRSNIEFRVRWKNRLSFQVHFYTDRVHSSGGNCYQLSFTNHHCYIQSYDNLGGTSRLGSFSPSSLDNDFEVSIRTDKEKKSITIFINNKLVKQIEDPSSFVGKGTGLLFYLNKGDIKISDIRVGQWNGLISGDLEKQKTQKQDSITFVNEDIISGVLTSIKGGKVVFETPFAPLTIPLERVSSITLGEDGQETPRRNGPDVEAYFAGMAGRVTLSLEKIENAKVSGSSENFGNASFDIRAFEKIVYNIYKQKTTDEEYEEW